MYRFDDKQRRRLLEDALVAELLEGALGESPSAVATRTGCANPASTLTAAPAGSTRVSKRGQ
jgi:hypothetical protein